MRDDLNDCYELLGVAPGATAEELKAAHRDLVKVWHPDRFSHDPRLQQKAQEKLKEINEAYDLLASGRPRRRATSPAPAAATRDPRPAPRPARWGLIFAAALVFGTVFFVASRALVPQGGAHSRRAEPPAGPTQTAPATERRPEAETPAAERQPRERKQVERPASEAATSPADAPRERAAEAARPLPTVTLLIDPTTGLLATPDCPVRSRITYSAGSEPRRPCDAPHKGREASH